MADVQLLAPGVKTAPLSYTIPGAQEIIVKAGFAAFDGSGAAGAFLPCIRVLAPGGKVVGEYFTDSTVAAGSSAEVSWAPFLRNAPAGTAGFAPKIAYATAGNAEISVPAGTNAALDYFSFVNPESYYSRTTFAGQTVSISAPSTTPTTAQYYVTANMSAHRPFFAAVDPADLRFYILGMSANFATDSPSVVSRATVGASLTGWSWLWDTVLIGATYSTIVYNDSASDYIVAVERSLVITLWDSF